MKISDHQLQIMFRVLEGSFRTDMNIFGYSAEDRRKLFNEILNQQSHEIVDVKPE